MNRRDFIKETAGAGLLAAVGCAVPASRRRDLIREENEKPGTSDWRLSNVQIEPGSRYRSRIIEGYCSRPSVRAGEALDLKVSTNPASPFVIDLFRLGYYGGKGGRAMGRLGPFRGTIQPDPAIGEGRIRECAWDTSARLVIPDDWPSGVYVGKLTAEVGGWQSYVIFVVRDDRPADFLFSCATHTWQAYNRWPNLFGLYNDGKKHWYWGPDVRVSYDRPYAQYSETGIVNAPLTTGSGSFLLWEFPLAFWMEQQGYDVTYGTSVDLIEHPDRLLRARTFLSVGHDEYWSPEGYRNVERALASGVHGAFLCGNSIFGIVPMGPSSAGVPNRTLTRTGVFAPNDPVLLDRPEQKNFKDFGPDAEYLMGARTVAPITGGGDWICTNEKHWLLEGTGMRNGDTVVGLVGWEYHGGPAPIPGLEVISTGPTDNGKKKGVYTTVLFPGPRKNLIFNAATIWWSLGLSEPPGYLRPGKVYVQPSGPDARVQRVTRNLFARLCEAPAL